MEKWVDIKGFENLYQISNYGNIRSKDRYKRNNSGTMLLKGRILKPIANNSGYLRIQLVSLQGDKKRFFVHRLVATHFLSIPSDPNKNIVNHIDCNPKNNNVNNLEWTTIKGNIHHAIRKGRMERTQQWLNHLREYNEKNGKSVVGTDIETGEKLYFICLNDCLKSGFQPSCVCNCCKGIRKTHKGYMWKYAN